MTTPEPSTPADGRGADTGATLFAATDPAQSAGDHLLVDAFVAAGRTLDNLPYTTDFDRLLERVRAKDAAHTAFTVLHRLQNLRKARKLPTLGRASTPAVKVSQDEEAALAALVAEHAGTLGQRDRLLYTPAFDAIVESFNALTGRTLTHHDVWRLVAKLAK